MVHTETHSLEAISIQTPRMVLRPLGAQDRDEFIRVHELSRELWRPWTPAQAAGDTASQQFTRAYETGLRGLQAGTQFRVIGELADGRIAGFFSLSEIVRGVFQNAYAGWRISAEVAGSGYATEGVRGILDLAFAAPGRGLGLHRVQANIIPANAASLRVAEKCGFRREGLAARYLQIAGFWQDHVMFARTREEHDFVYLRV
jgi:ribosomal-protein-alanine N-acetyltransferase